MVIGGTAKIQTLFIFVKIPRQAASQTAEAHIISLR
jgi:hypothetical protein